MDRWQAYLVTFIVAVEPLRKLLEKLIAGVDCTKQVENNIVMAGADCTKQVANN